ncbi:nitroreductase [Candidatus Omnitrophus magneticus]|uniref:Nitroreductase n=1 Tax=Candidatus Omnitrophus magneticus TaxID=1609969 RepID=A0A0F0CS54_9BACT|nr:nitroreductase [Candidatus Omnitrophus magneticus]
MKESNIFKIIKNRWSVREYKKDIVSDREMNILLESGRWAPSGLNNQPWRFIIVKDTGIKNILADFTKYGHVIKNAFMVICVFLDKKTSYHREKDIMAIGASIQNILLTADDIGLGACWLGEILNKKEQVEKILKVTGKYELMAVITVGVPVLKPRKSNRRKLKDLVLFKHN